MAGTQGRVYHPCVDYQLAHINIMSSMKNSSSPLKMLYFQSQMAGPLDSGETKRRWITSIAMTTSQRRI